MQRHDVTAFWKDTRKHTKSISALSNCIDGITGEADIADMCGRHYEQLLNDSYKSFIADNCPYTYIKKIKNTSTKIQHSKLKLMKRY